MKAIGGGGGETRKSAGRSRMDSQLTMSDFAVHMVAPAFSGKTPIARHRLVNALLRDEFDNMGLHALSLRLNSPEEWQKQGGGDLKA
jgi:stress-induced morphogen